MTPDTRAVGDTSPAGTRTATSARRSAADVAYEQVKEQIVDLRLPPGTIVNETSLAAQLRIGRTPVHEALARLASDRFVTVLPRRGTMVATLALADVLDLFEAREAIECGVAHIAATRASDADLAQLRTLIANADRAREGQAHEAYLRDDHAIHAFLIHMINNALLRDTGDLLLQHNLRFWRWYWDARPPRAQAMYSHHSLLVALEDHDPLRASEAMRAHIADSRQAIHALF